MEEGAVLCPSDRRSAPVCRRSMPGRDGATLPPSRWTSSQACRNAVRTSVTAPNKRVSSLLSTCTRPESIEMPPKYLSHLSRASTTAANSSFTVRSSTCPRLTIVSSLWRGPPRWLLASNMVQFLRTPELCMPGALPLPLLRNPGRSAPQLPFEASLGSRDTVMLRQPCATPAATMPSKVPFVGKMCGTPRGVVSQLRGWLPSPRESNDKELRQAM
mmetsp:Transcript_76439/g.196866  ORF Transcript_76439/g.196866 Transcript_76439/m.196866 type:complete len:216 (-) Transcript_76439:147-794(-)